MLPKTQVIAHRGASAYAPENTMAAFERALKMGCPYIEFDVMLSQDGVPFVFHDEHLKRTSSGKGLFAEKNAAELKTLDAGTWFSKQYANQTIPTFEDVLHWMLKNNVFANIEIKPTPGKTEETATAVMQMLHQLWPYDKALPLVSSFDHEALKLCRALNPDLPIGALFWGWAPKWKQVAEALQCVSIHFNKEALNQTRVREIKKEGYQVWVYTVNQKRLAHKLFSWGVDTIFSDYPELLS